MNWTDILVFIAGIVAKVVFDLLGDNVSRRLKDFIIRRAKARYSVTSTPTPTKEFHCYRIGNLEIPVMSIVGSPETAFNLNEVIVKFRPAFRHQEDDYPVELWSAQSHLVDECRRRYGLTSVSVESIVPRLDSITQGPESEGDKRGHLYINISLTTFASYIATNKSLNYAIIPKGGLVSRFISNQTIRDAYAHPPYENFSKSVLANPLSVHIAVISRNLNQNPKLDFIHLK